MQTEYRLVLLLQLFTQRICMRLLTVLYLLCMLYLGLSNETKTQIIRFSIFYTQAFASHYDYISYYHKWRSNLYRKTYTSALTYMYISKKLTILYLQCLISRVNLLEI